MNVLWIDRAMMELPMYVGLCISEKAFERELKRIKVDRANTPEWISNSQSDATAHYFEESESGRNCAIICMRNMDDRDRVEVNGLLVHEAVHIWQWVKRYIGEDNPSKEFEAYSIQHIAQELMIAYEKYEKEMAKKGTTSK